MWGVQLELFRFHVEASPLVFCHLRSSRRSSCQSRGLRYLEWFHGWSLTGGPRLYRTRARTFLRSYAAESLFIIGLELQSNIPNKEGTCSASPSLSTTRLTAQIGFSSDDGAAISSLNDLTCAIMYDDGRFHYTPLIVT